MAENPFIDQFASRPGVRVTLRANDNSIIKTTDVSSAGIPPKSRIAFCKNIMFDERPAAVEIKPLRADYEPTPFAPSEFKTFEVLNVSFRDGHRPWRRITGEVRNPYPADTGAWVTFLFRDAAGKLVGGLSQYLSDVPAGDPTPFDIMVMADEIPDRLAKAEHIAFNHINYQRNWFPLLRR